jgi:hypothetical protein
MVETGRGADGERLRCGCRPDFIQGPFQIGDIDHHREAVPAGDSPRESHLMVVHGLSELRLPGNHYQAFAQLERVEEADAALGNHQVGSTDILRQAVLEGEAPGMDWPVGSMTELDGDFQSWMEPCVSIQGFDQPIESGGMHADHAENHITAPWYFALGP